jgi:hypothetical protein
LRKLGHIIFGRIGPFCGPDVRLVLEDDSSQQPEEI